MNTLDWPALGRALRADADDAHGGDTPPVDLAYQFLIENPECFTDFTGRQAELCSSCGLALAHVAGPGQGETGLVCYTPGCDLQDVEMARTGDEPEWPADMPQEPPEELIAAYFGRPMESLELLCALQMQRVAACELASIRFPLDGEELARITIFHVYIAYVKAMYDPRPVVASAVVAALAPCADYRTCTDPACARTHVWDPHGDECACEHCADPFGVVMGRRRS